MSATGSGKYQKRSNSSEWTEAVFPSAFVLMLVLSVVYFVHSNSLSS